MSSPDFARSRRDNLQDAWASENARRKRLAATALIAAKLEAARDALPTTLAQDRVSLASLHGGMATRRSCTSKNL